MVAKPGRKATDYRGMELLYVFIYCIYQITRAITYQNVKGNYFLK